MFNVTINSESTETTNQTTQFADANSQWNYTVSTGMDPTYHDTDSASDATLQEFFSRPIKIGSFAWLPGVNFFQVLNPWDAFFSDKRVANRLVNYALLRCKLKIRIMVNGNSFYYGRICASYRPLPGFDEFSTSRAAVFNDMIQESQRPHVYINPTESRGGDLTCPYIWSGNYFTIPEEQWTGGGEAAELVMRSFGPLKHANGATEPVTVSVFAWAEDVEISIPTSNQPGSLTPQAGPDEYGQGIISKTANVIADTAGAASNIPAISKYAIATSTMARAIGAVAGAYGYSKPAQLTETFQTPAVFPNSVNVEGADNTVKLSLDPKQETSIDPSVMGIGDTDEMVIKSVAMRESYLTSFSWSLANIAEAKLFAITVSPVVWNSNIDPLTALTEIHMPACCFATMPFRHWRGSMKYRFQIVCSAFHKGRLRVMYDPSSQISQEYNLNYSYIVDISNENDFTVQVGWGADRSMLQHQAPGDEPPPFGPTHTISPSYQNNGILSVYVLNELTTPNSAVDNDIQVNVFVSACDDYQVWNPSVQWIDNYSYFNSNAPAEAALALGDSNLKPPPVPQEEIDLPPDEDGGKILDSQSGLTHPDEHQTDDQDAPMQDKVTNLAPLKTSPGIHHVYYGDPVLSFRQCLKRYNYHSSLIPILNARSWSKWQLPNFPMYRGYAPSAIHRTSTDVPYNYMKNTLMNYLTPAYIMRRGSIRWRYFRERGTTSTFTGGFMQVVRIPFAPAPGYYYINAPVLDATTSIHTRAREAAVQIPSTWAGAHVVDSTTSPVISVDLPWYSPTRFAYGRLASVNSSSGGFIDHQFHQLTTQFTTQGAGTLASRIDTYVAAGDDFTLAMFAGAPRMYRMAIGADPAPLA